MADDSCELIEVNSPWERVPQHESDPGFGPVPPRSKIVELFQRPESDGCDTTSSESKEG